MIYIGAETIQSPLGLTLRENYEAVLAGKSGIARYEGKGWNGSDVYLSKITGLADSGKFSALLQRCFEEVMSGLHRDLVSTDRMLVIISSTKGDLEAAPAYPFEPAVDYLMARNGLKHRPVVISNACVSGVMAVNQAALLLGAGLHEHVAVLGCDVLSDFVLYGFQSLFAVSGQPCRPFDRDRAGVTLGEGSGGVFLSRDPAVFRTRPLQFVAGSASNDANHISGPSRTGEGLVRTVTRTMRKGKVSRNEIGFISAHGTGTGFNDEMEAIAFNRLEMGEVPLASLKACWGHTLGAAGVMETALTMQSLREGVFPASKGFTVQGTSRPLRVLTETALLQTEMALKTASGFGGCNASLLIRKI